MAHSHDHGHNHGHSHGHSHGHHHHEAVGNIRFAFFVNLSFAIIELIGGFFSNSLSIMSGALHDFGDSLSLGLAWYFQNLSAKKRDSKFSYGYGRFSLLGAVINSIVLTVGSVLILREAIPRIWSPNVVHAKSMLIMAVLGIVFNAAALLRLQLGKTKNERVVSLHFIEDIMSWVAVLVGSLVFYFTHWAWIDPVLSVLISCYMFYNVYHNIRHSMKIFLQGIPDELQMDKVETEIRSLAGVLGLHDLHVWTLDGEYNILSLHVVVSNLMPMPEVETLKGNIRHLLQHKSIGHVTIEMETEDQNCGLEEC